jgi:hypothetical protein
MTLPAQVQTPVHPGRPAWALVGSGGFDALAGGIWWAWDANPNRGKVLLLVGLLIALTGVVLTRRTDRLPARAVAVVAVLIVLFAGYEIWDAISTIATQDAAHTA